MKQFSGACIYVLWSHVAALPCDFMASAEASAPAQDVRQVHREHANFVWRSLQRLGVRGAELEDAHQEVFIVVYRKLSTFDGTAKMTSWLFGICMRVASAARRKAHRRHELLTDVLPESPSGAAGPETSLERRQAAAVVDHVLDSLDLEKRAIFVMYEIDQLSCQEIAEVVGIPLGTVHSRLHTARKEFQEGIKRSTLRSERSGLSSAQEGDRS